MSPFLLRDSEAEWGHSYCDASKGWVVARYVPFLLRDSEAEWGHSYFVDASKGLGCRPLCPHSYCGTRKRKGTQLFC